jgi:hypothetical protein
VGGDDRPGHLDRPLLRPDRLRDRHVRRRRVRRSGAGRVRRRQPAVGVAQRDGDGRLSLRLRHGARGRRGVRRLHGEPRAPGAPPVRQPVVLRVPRHPGGDRRGAGQVHQQGDGELRQLGGDPLPLTPLLPPPPPPHLLPPSPSAR